MGRMSETTRHHIINPDAVSAYKESSCNNQVQLVMYPKEYTAWKHSVS